MLVKGETLILSNILHLFYKNEIMETLYIPINLIDIPKEISKKEEINPKNSEYYNTIKHYKAQNNHFRKQLIQKPISRIFIPIKFDE